MVRMSQFWEENKDLVFGWLPYALTFFCILARMWWVVIPLAFAVLDVAFLIATEPGRRTKWSIVVPGGGFYVFFVHKSKGSA